MVASQDLMPYRQESLINGKGIAETIENVKAITQLLQRISKLRAGRPVDHLQGAQNLDIDRSGIFESLLAEQRFRPGQSGVDILLL